MRRTAPLRRCLGPALGLLLLAGHPIAAGEARVREKQPLAELRDGKPAAAPGTPEPRGAGSSLGWKLGGPGIGLALCGLTVITIRRRRARGTTPNEAGVVQVVGRALLSHRHAIFVVQVSGRRLVVGVSGDRMTALDAFEPAGEAAAEPVEEPAPAPAPLRGYSVRPKDRQALLARREDDAAELRPYRQKMDRLRDALREIRGDARGAGMEGA